MFYIQLRDLIKQDPSMYIYLSNKKIQVQRRYSDFKILRTTLVQKWPGCYIPPLPPKKAIVYQQFPPYQFKGNMDQKFIEDRMKQLEGFCQKISVAKYLWYSEEFQIFIRTSNVDIEKVQLYGTNFFYRLYCKYQRLPMKRLQTNIRKIFQNYQEYANILFIILLKLKKEINMVIISKIQEFQVFLQRVSPMVENFKQIARLINMLFYDRNIAKARQGNQEQLLNVLQVVLPEYEQYILQEYTEQPEKLIISNTEKNQNLNQALLKYKELLNLNEFNTLYEQIRFESKELKAFQETLSQREKYELQKAQLEQKQKEYQLELQQVLAGKTTLKSIFSKGNKDENISKLQISIDNVNKDIDNIQFICDILTVLLGYIEIDKFKVFLYKKQQIYFSMVKNLISYEIQINKIAQEFWENVKENSYLI